MAQPVSDQSMTFRQGIDRSGERVHTQPMGRLHVVEAADQRRGDSRLRMSWHDDKEVLVVSHWRGPICVASTPVEVKDLPGMITLMAQAIEEAAAASGDRPYALSARSLRRDALTLLRSRLRPTFAPIVQLAKRRGQPSI